MSNETRPWPSRKPSRSVLLRWRPLEPRSESPGLSYKDIETSLGAYSKAASAGVRQLAFGGIAIAWLLREERSVQVTKGAVVTTASSFHLQTVQYWALAVFALAIIVDVAQYVFGTIVYLSAVEQYETDAELNTTPAPYRTLGDACVEHKHVVARVFRRFFCTKVALVFFAYGLLAWAVV